MAIEKELDNVTGGSGITPQVVIPNVIDIDEEDAKRILGNMGIDCETIYISHQNPKGTVVKSDPSTGERVTLPCTVRLFVSKGLDR